MAAARRAFGEQRIGHTGTLDPLATGVLPLALGRATRLVRFLTASDKDYDATIRFGLTTDTYDITGAETSRSDRSPGREDVERALASLRGEYLQMPPAYSAKKVGGRRAYELARRDEAVDARRRAGHGRRARSCWRSTAARRAWRHLLGRLLRAVVRACARRADGHRRVPRGAAADAKRRLRPRATRSPLEQSSQDPAGARRAASIPLERLLERVPGGPCCRDGQAVPTARLSSREAGQVDGRRGGDRTGCGCSTPTGRWWRWPRPGRGPVLCTRPSC